MSSIWPYLWICMLVVSCVLVGWVARGINENGGLNRSMAWGYDEKDNVWNRIRVDAQGYVLCHKEGK